MITSAELAMLRAMLNGAVLPGLDTQTGNQTPTGSLIGLSQLPVTLGGAYHYVPSTNRVYITKAGTVLKNINFGSATVIIAANNVTIQNCTFVNTTSYGSVSQPAGYSGATVTNCTFSNSGPTANLDFISSAGMITITNNTFINAGKDDIDLFGPAVVTGNYMLGGGFNTEGDHPDAIWVTNAAGPILIQNNFIDWTPAPGAIQPDNDVIRITTELGNVSDLTITGNYLIGATTIVGAGTQGAGTFTNVLVANNYVGVGGWCGAPVAGLTEYNNIDFDFSNPIYSTRAWAAYQSAGLVTNTLVTQTAAGGTISASGPGSTTLYGGGFKSGLVGGAGENIIIGGAGVQYMGGGSGKNIFTYLAMSDSMPWLPDLIGNFHVATDVIDLHAINANVLSPEFKNLRFIGSAAFSSAGGEVRVEQDVAHGITLVQANLIGNTTADLSVRINGLLNLTAANFVLTTAQYEAAIAGSTTVASFQSTQPLLDQVAGGFSIVDTVANVQANLTGLLADSAHINAVTLIDGALSVDAATFRADQPLLNAIVGVFNVADTAAHVQADLAALQADAGHIGAITATGGPVSVSVATFLADQAVLNKIVGGFEIVDTAANIQANLKALNADAAHIDTVTPTGGVLRVNAAPFAAMQGVSPPTGGLVTVSAATFAADQPFLNKIAGGFAVSDTAANIQANLKGLNADAANIAAITATSGIVSVSVATFLANQPALNDMVGGFAIADSPVNIQANLAALQADVANIVSVTATYGSVTVSVAGFKADQAVLDTVVGGFRISDTAANVQANLGALNADAAHIAGTTTTGGTVSVSAATFLADAAALNDIAGGFDLSDTSANVKANLAALEADVGHIGRITATDGPVSVTAATFLANQPALDKVVGTVKIADTAANIQANLSALQRYAGSVDAITSTAGRVTVNVATFAANQTVLNKTVGGFAVTDTAANITTYLNWLNADAANIVTTTATGGTVSVTAATFLKDEAALNEIAGGFAISDSPSNIQNNLAALRADNAHIVSIAASYGAVTTSVAGLAANRAVLDKIVGGFGLNDSSAHVQSGIDALGADSAHIRSVTLTDSTAQTPAVLMLTSSQAANDSAILAKIASPYVQKTISNGTTTVIGHGNGLTIDIGPGDSVVTGGGVRETLAFSPNFGSIVVTDFAANAGNGLHDTISLSTSDFADWATLVSDGHASGAGGADTTFIAANGASLTIAGVNLSAFQHPSAALKADFAFHA
jgi:hypothetical protein